MPKILVVEDANFFSTVLKKGIEKRLGFEAVCARTFREAEQVLRESASDFYLSFLDLNLPDAANGEIVDLANEYGVPAIVFTADFSPGRREELFEKGIIDYVLKDTPASVDYLLNLAGRLYRNRSATALVVDDSATTRRHIRRLLETSQFQVVEAENGEHALSVLDGDPS